MCSIASAFVRNQSPPPVTSSPHSNCQRGLLLRHDLWWFHSPGWDEVQICHRGIRPRMHVCVVLEKTGVSCFIYLVSQKFSLWCWRLLVRSLLKGFKKGTSIYLASVCCMCKCIRTRCRVRVRNYLIAPTVQPWLTFWLTACLLTDLNRWLVNKQNWKTHQLGVQSFSLVLSL